MSGLYTTGVYNPQNLRDILVALGILLYGQYRENILPEGVFNYVEKYVRTAGNAPQGLYCYNFCLNTNPFETQPSGAMNMSRFTNVQFEFYFVIRLDHNTLQICCCLLQMVAFLHRGM